MGGPPTPSRGARNLAVVALTLAVALAPQLIGGAFASLAAATALLTTAAALLALSAVVPEQLPRRMAPVLVMFGLGLLATGFQALPLPCSLVETLAPASAEASRAAQSLLGIAEPSCTLSLDRGNTLIALVRWTALTAAALAAFCLNAARRGTWVARAVAISGVLLAIVSF